ALTDDLSTFYELCSPDCRVWHSSDNKWVPFRDAIDAVKQRGGLPHFGDIRTFTTAKGFLLQASVTLEPMGRTHITQLVTVKDRNAAEVEEYTAPEKKLPA